VKRIIGFLVVAALIAVAAGCVTVDKFDLTIASTAGGVVTAPGEGTSNHDVGEVVPLVATSDAGYRFGGWTGDVAGIGDVENATTTITMYDNCSIAASFVKQQYDLTTSSTAGGSVTVPGEGTATYDEGAVVSLVAEAEEDYRFVGWTGGVNTIDDIEAAITTIIVDGDCTVVANFDQIPPLEPFHLAVFSAPGGSVTVPGEGPFTYDAGTVVGLAATPASGYRFVRWTGNVGTVANVNAASTTITMHGDYSIMANFEPILPVQYGLTITSTAGGWVINPGSGTFMCNAGTVVSLMATPASGYRFVRWTGNVGTVANVNSASTTITMNGSYSIRADFEVISGGQHMLTISSTSGGSVTVPGEGTFTCDAGAVVSLTAMPAAGYQFVSWTGDVGTVADVNSASTAVTMDGSYSIRADFSQDASSPPGVSYTEAEAEQLIIVLVNGERQQSGLPALSEDALLMSLAWEHSTSMVENNFFGHQRYPGERSLSYNQPPGTIRGENLAMIPTRRTIPGPYLSLQEVCEWAVSAWMASPGHSANILEPRYTKTGVGVRLSGDYLYITQIFEGYY
jgi:uncharacterized repeat protein (TIGR02543 family)